jgi:hypothetical protein
MRYAHVVAKEDNRVFFRGYVSKPKIKDRQTRELTCKGEEDLLLRRRSPRFAYQVSTRRLYHAFQSDPPNQTADTYGVTGNVGLLFMANSSIPYVGNTVIGSAPIEYDWWALTTDWIYKLSGLGTKSRIGSAAIYAAGKLLPRVNSYDDLLNVDISCFSDENDLWVRLDEADDKDRCGFGPKYPMFAENCYDTGIRQGTIDHPETVLTGNLQLNYDRMMDVIKDLAEFYGLNPRFRRERDATYLDCLDEPVENEFTITEDKIADITHLFSDDSQVHALYGLGYGSRDVQHVYVPSDHQWKGIWLSDSMDVDEGFIDAIGNVRPYINAEYAFRQADEMFDISPTPDWSGRPRPCDMIRLQLDGEAERLLQVASCSIDSNGKYEMEIGGRSSDIVDAFNSRDSLDRVYLNEYLVEYGKSLSASGSALQMGDDAHGSCAGGSFSITIPTDVYESDWSHRVTLDISITADQSPVACRVYVVVNGGENIYTQMPYYLLGDPISGLDITRLCNYGSASTIGVWVEKIGEWPGAACANHPTMDINITVRCWKRTILGSDIKRGLNKQKIIYATWKKVKNNVYRWGIP